MSLLINAPQFKSHRYQSNSSFTVPSDNDAMEIDEEPKRKKRRKTIFFI
jgi:hypothetical protein